MNRQAVTQQVSYLSGVVKDTRFYGVSEIEWQEAQRTTDLGI
ncbi:MAG TPA: hypothetical protein VHL11_11590 [Phototrophicaceae bacterium]|nr:hypothetical protein [Phototrophicaceae bacterium]